VTSEYEFDAEIIEGNKTFLNNLFYSLNAKKFILNTNECDIKVEFYGFNNEINTNCSKFEENAVKQPFLSCIGESKEIYFFECFNFDTYKMRNQKLYSKFSPFLKISVNEKLISEMNFTTNIRIELYENARPDTIQKTYYDFDNLINWYFYSKSTETYLESPYKSQCSHYNKNTNPFDSVSYIDCLVKCIDESCQRKHNCSTHHRIFEHQIEEMWLKYRYLTCDDPHLTFQDCGENFMKECKIMCPIDCIKDNYIFEDGFVSNDNESNSERVTKLFWDSGKTFISYEETPNMLLLDYFTYIGGLFGLWFGICVENIMEIIINNAKSLKNYLNVKSKMLFTLISLFLKSFCTSLFHCINISIHNLFDSFKHFGLWFGICLKSSMDLIVKNAKIFGHYLKALSEMIFSLILFLLKLFYKSSLYLINWLIYIIIEFFVKTKGIICLFFERYINLRIGVEF
jgi:hypothetical protein